MKASQLISALQKVIDQHGDIPCLIEINDSAGCYMMPVDELNVEDRPAFGMSVSLLE